jgi:glycosyltransferase involved in cell wall biosynthesis
MTELLVHALASPERTLRPDVRVEVMHDRAFFEALAASNKGFTATSPYPAYLEALSRADISLMPLADNAINRCKSDAKFIEAAAAGAGVLASPTAYEASIRDGETGLIFRTLEEFEAKLAALLDSAGLRRQLAVAAYDYVRGERMLSQHIGRQAAWYRSLCAQHAQLTAALAARVPELGSALP